MKHMSLAEIAKACGGSYVGDDGLKSVEVTGVVIDSRKVEPGFLFAAVKGERVDGHSFIPAVFAKGAACVPVSYTHLMCRASTALPRIRRWVSRQ